MYPVIRLVTGGWSSELAGKLMELEQPDLGPDRESRHVGPGTVVIVRAERRQGCPIPPTGSDRDRARGPDGCDGGHYLVGHRLGRMGSEQYRVPVNGAHTPVMLLLDTCVFGSIGRVWSVLQ